MRVCVRVFTRDDAKLNDDRESYFNGEEEEPEAAAKKPPKNENKS